MNGLTLVGIAIVVLVLAYLLYGRWLVKTWGIDPNAKTPAYRYEDGQDYVPASRFTVFSHQFNSITGAGPGCDVRLATCFLMAVSRRRIFRSCSRFYGLICFSQE